MGRSAKFTEEQILDAALALVADGGPRAATIAALGERIGAPVGSIYHRFGSRDLLLAQLWIRTVKRFQHGFLEALADADVERGGERAALHVVRWAREHPDEARIMLMYRREDLSDQWPTELGEQLATLNADVAAGIAAYAERRFGGAGEGALQRVNFALIDVPYAAGRRYLLGGQAPPASVDHLVLATCRAVLAP